MNMRDFLDYITMNYSEDKEYFIKIELQRMMSEGISVPEEFLNHCFVQKSPKKKHYLISMLRERVEGVASDHANNTLDLSIKTEVPVQKPLITFEPVLTVLPSVEQSVSHKVYTEQSVVELPKVDPMVAYIPEKDKSFVPHGDNWRLISEVVKDRRFFPIYVYGVSGVGKTMQIEQACAACSRPYFRVQITRETTNEDLIGSYRLVDGNTVWQDGPVIQAYRLGAVVVLDEIDLNPGLMVLQPVLENKPVYINQTGELVSPQPGFTVFATGNTKGDGTDYRFTGTMVLNDAFLERFIVMLEQKIPTISVEQKIVKAFLKSNPDIEISENQLQCLMRWTDLARKTFADGNISSYVSSRRLSCVLKIHGITGDINRSLSMAMARYPDEDCNALIALWKSIYTES